MKTTFAIAAFVAAVSAQGLAGLPQCAESCALNGIGSTGCQLTDVKCICTSTSFLQSVEGCIATACSAADQAKTIAFAQSFCASAGVTITPPAGSSSAAPATSSSAAAAPPASTTMMSSAAAATTSAGAAAPTGSSNSTGNGTTSSPPAQFTGGASALQLGSWAVAAFGAVMAAAL